MFCFNKSIIQIKKKFINSKHISKFQLISLTKQNNSNFFFKFETAPPPTPPKRDPCYPSPCGSNARCRVENDYAVCECLPEYHGNPYESCRPECLSNPDCPSNTACIRNKCQDPCPGTCGVNAICTVTNHVPVCTCQVGYTGDAFRYCSVVVEGIYQFFSNEPLVSWSFCRRTTKRPMQPVTLRFEYGLSHFGQIRHMRMSTWILWKS